MALIQLSSGYGIQLLVPGIFFVLVTGFLAIQIKAARIHTSVELTSETPASGHGNAFASATIVRVYPEPKGPDEPKWQSARALGELTGVPRRRTGHRPQADERSRRPGVGAQARGTAGRAYAFGGRAHPSGKRCHEGQDRNWCLPWSRQQAAC